MGKRRGKRKRRESFFNKTVDNHPGIVYMYTIEKSIKRGMNENRDISFLCHRSHFFYRH